VAKCRFVGVYGDVIRVKIMFNKKDKALVQFADGKQAQLGMTMTYDSSVLLLLLWYIEIFEQIKMNE